MLMEKEQKENKYENKIIQIVSSRWFYNSEFRTFFFRCNVKSVLKRNSEKNKNIERYFNFSANHKFTVESSQLENISHNLTRTFFLVPKPVSR